MNILRAAIGDTTQANVLVARERLKLNRGLHKTWPKIYMQWLNSILTVSNIFQYRTEYVIDKQCIFL